MGEKIILGGLSFLLFTGTGTIANQHIFDVTTLIKKTPYVNPIDEIEVKRKVVSGYKKEGLSRLKTTNGKKVGQMHYSDLLNSDPRYWEKEQDPAFDRVWRKRFEALKRKPSNSFKTNIFFRMAKLDDFYILPKFCWKVYMIDTTKKNLATATGTHWFLPENWDTVNLENKTIEDFWSDAWIMCQLNEKLKKPVKWGKKSDTGIITT